ncbi:MAG TPA: hypothetical protein VKY19_14290 [Ktedonosporobacter sp.]|jgi:hypothetical protein|nr:hypothetical protein [Ktedonosporobacter sp.]
MAENSQQQATTLAQKADIVAGIAMFLMLPVIVFLRRKVGYRFLNPTRVSAMVLILFIYGIFTLTSTSLSQGQQPATINYYGQPVTAQQAQTAAATAEFAVVSHYLGALAVIFFAGLVFLVAMVQRQLRWRDIKRGIPWHTYSRGVSWFSFLPLSDNHIKRFVEPIICAVIGLILAFLLPYLGFYILLAAGCLFIFAAWDYEIQLNQMLDMLDSMIDSEVMSANVEYYSQEKPKQKPITETAGIPTGISPDLQHQIERRKVKKHIALDDLGEAQTQAAV